MKQRFTDITINGEFYTSTNLLVLSNKKIQSKTTPDWEISLYKFILNWISDSPTIEVKTSGSTGKPKTMLLEKEKMIQSAVRTGAFFQLKKNDTALLCLPVDFIAGKMMLVRAFVLGLNLIPIEPKGNPLEVFDENFHFAAMTPMQVSKTLDDSNGAKKLDKIQNLIVGGGEVSQDLARKIVGLKNNTWHTYGMTETITHVALKKLNGINATNYFAALGDVTFEKDQRDCLMIKASYLSEKSIITNDIVELISDTKFEFLGRYDNIINTGGVKVLPELIEKKLEPCISQFFAISSIPDKSLGEKVVLIVESVRNININLDEFSTKGNLTKFEKPKETLKIDKIPLTENGKIDRKRLNKTILIG